MSIKCSKQNYKYPQWWDNDLTLMRSKLRKYSKLGTPEGRSNYISLRREYKKPLKRLKMMDGRNLLQHQISK